MVGNWVVDIVFRRWVVQYGDWEVGVVNLVVGKYVGVILVIGKWVGHWEIGKEMFGSYR